MRRIYRDRRPVTSNESFTSVSQVYSHATSVATGSGHLWK